MMGCILALFRGIFAQFCVIFISNIYFLKNFPSLNLFPPHQPKNI